MTLNDPAVRRTLARQKWLYRAMRREQKLLAQGKAYTPSVETNIGKTWARYDYTPPSTLRSQA